MPSKRAGLIWADAQGEQVLHVITTATGVGAIESALAAQSNAGVVECWEGTLEAFSPSPVASTYPSSRSVAILLFRDDVGSTARLYVPAPVSALFNSAGDTVDPTAAAGIIAAAIGNLRAGSGNVVTQFTGGYLSKAPTRAVETTDVVAFVNPMTALGDMIYSVDGAGSAGRLAIGTTGEILGVSAGIPAWVPEPVGLPITTATNYLTAAVSMVAANTFYDGPSLTLAAGDWFLTGLLTLESNGPLGPITVKLWDGTTVTSTASANWGVSGDAAIPVSGIVHPTGSTTYKISAAAAAVISSKIDATPRQNNTGATNTASWLLAMKIG